MHARTLTALIGTMAIAGCNAQTSGTADEAAGAANASGGNTAVAQPAAPAATPSGTATPETTLGAQIDFGALAGTWKVAAVATGDGVQALVPDDPAYMGREVTISGDRLAWVDAAKAGAATLDDVCDLPVTARQTGTAATNYDTQFAPQLKKLSIARPDPHAVECDRGNWGPEAAGGAILFPAGKDALAMSWYDGAVLKLIRVR